jgi:hypothetical protein
MRGDEARAARDRAVSASHLSSPHTLSEQIEHGWTRLMYIIDHAVTILRPHIHFVLRTMTSASHMLTTFMRALWQHIVAWIGR